jgi:hypothetical protein
MSCCIGPKVELEQVAIGGQSSQSFEETNSFPEQGKHQIHNPCIGFTLQYLLYVHGCAFTCRSWMETSCIMAPPFMNTLSTPTMDLER